MSKKKLALFSVIIANITIILSACSNNNTSQEFDEMTTFAMDTIMSFTLETSELYDTQEVFINVENQIRQFENLFSWRIENSDIYSINNSQAMDYASVSDDTIEILEIANIMSEETDGAFSVTISPLVDLWGFGDEEKVPQYEDIENVLEFIDWRGVYIDNENNSVALAQDNMSLDLGAIAKGFVAEKITDYLQDIGVENGHFSLGGNISTIGLKNDGSRWKIAIQNPLDANNHLGIIEASDVFIVTSGGYQRYFVEDGITYHHILDCSTGYPSDSGLLSVTIICNDGTVADVLSTAFFVMGLDKSLEYLQNNDYVEVIFVTEDGEVVATSGADEIFDFNGEDNEFSYRVVD